MDRSAFIVACNDILVWCWQSWRATGHQLDGILHPDCSHSLVVSVAINEQEPEGPEQRKSGQP